MSNYTREASQILQSKYGGYCKMCEEMCEDTTPYHSFDLNIYNLMRNKYKEHRKMLSSINPNM